MSGEEILGQRRDITGVSYDRCDVCGGVFSVSQLNEVDARLQYAESDQPLRVCADCSARIYSGELDPETILSDDDDWRE